MKTLKSYLLETGETQSAFARRCAISNATVSRLCSEAMVPSLELAHLIEDATKGNVKTEIWIRSHADTA